jgi:acetyl-CoA synthetase
MRDYREVYDNLSAAALERQLLHGTLAGGLNACIECCDRWAESDRIALEWYGVDGERETLTFAILREGAARFANLLAANGIGRGDVVAAMLPRIPELLIVILGTWRAGAIYQPLFTAFGPKAIELRTTAPGGSQAKLIVTDAANRRKLDEVAFCPPRLLVDRGNPGATDIAQNLAQQSPEFAPVMLHGDDPFVVLFTSGTTGNPKGVRWPLRFLLPTAVYMLDAVDLRSTDRYWTVADPGWAYGMICAICGPLQIGHATTFYAGPFTASSTVWIISGARITNLAAAPTAYRLLMAAGAEAVAPIRGKLRVASSAGEPLNPEVARWADAVLCCQLHDRYGQTETGMLVNNHHGLRHPVKPGSAGVPMPGFQVAVLDDELRPVPPNTPGVLAVHRHNSPLFAFEGYWRAATPALRGDWYLTGDTMEMDENGYLSFVGRNDDIITSAGYRIGPFDVESVIIEHPAVAEVAVVGKPDAERTEIVKAFVVPRPHVRPDDAMVAEIQQHVRTRLSTHAYPREIAFVEELPKTPSGKIQRFLLKQLG